MSFLIPKIKQLGNAQIGIIELPEHGSLRLDELLFVEQRNLKSTRDIVLFFAEQHSFLSGDLVASYNLLLKSLRGELSATDAETDPTIVQVVENMAQAMEKSSKRTTYVYAAAIVKHRGNMPDATIKDLRTANGIHPQLVQELAQFALDEASGGKAGKPDKFAPVSSKAEIDAKARTKAENNWDEIFLSLGRYFPSLPVFQDEALFLQRPVNWISWMMEQGVERRRQELHEMERPIAFLRYNFIQANSKKGAKEIKIEDIYLYASKTKEDVGIPSDVCNVFFSLSAEEKLPEWFHTFQVVEQMRLHQNQDALFYPRALFGSGVGLLCWEEGPAGIEAQFVCIDASCPGGVQHVKDPDTGKTFRVLIEGYDEGYYVSETIPIYGNAARAT